MTPRTFLRLSLALAALHLTASAARAGDVATLNILGFNADGTVFAFEEYGMEDGSGFPYANRFYIDTAADKFVGSSPIRVRIDNESASVAEARKKARIAGEIIVSDEILTASHGYLAGINAITELSADPHRITVNPRPVIPPVDTPLEFRLEEIPFPTSGFCNDMADYSTGFRLLSIEARPGAAPQLLHADASVPSSRGCPTGYRIGGVQTFFPFKGPSAYAVMITVESVGFEGPDYRWMAVTRRPGG